MRFTTVRILRSETEQRELDVGVWEIPILRLLYGDPSIEEVGEIEVDRPYPEPGYEYARLEARYKSNENDGASFVSMIYGHGDTGVKKLAAAIREESSQYPHQEKRAAIAPPPDAGEIANLRAQLEAAEARAKSAEDALDFATAPQAQVPNAGLPATAKPLPPAAKSGPALTPKPAAPTFPKPAAGPAAGSSSGLATEITE